MRNLFAQQKLASLAGVFWVMLSRGAGDVVATPERGPVRAVQRGAAVWPDDQSRAFAVQFARAYPSSSPRQTERAAREPALTCGFPAWFCRFCCSLGILTVLQAFSLTWLAAGVASGATYLLFVRRVRLWLTCGLVRPCGA
jgi:hypothetical protein